MSSPSFPSSTGRRIGMISLGCPKNLVDSEVLLGGLQAQGHVVTADPEQADILLVNTCGFIASAEEESRQAIGEMARLRAAWPDKRLVVTGCLAQRHGERLAQEYPGIDLLLGPGQVEPLLAFVAAQGEVRQDHAGPTGLAKIDADRPELATAQVPRLLTTPPHLAYLKIAEGCNNPCTFCIIPQLRGPFRSRPLADIGMEAARLLAQGVRELVLVAQDTTLYGRDLTPRTDLATLLESLVVLPEVASGKAWIRMLYLYPTLLNERLLECMARLAPAVVPYLDIPLQHAHPDVLQRMRRSERAETLVRLFERIRTLLPQAVVRTTFIVGFPGETEAEFSQLRDFVRAIRFDHVGVFVYSDEPEAASFQMTDKVPVEVATARRDTLMRLQQKISQQRLAKQVGRRIPVMLDGRSTSDPRIWIGRTPGQAFEIDGVVLVDVAGKAAKARCVPGAIVPVAVTGATPYDLHGHVVT